nr:reverse transcriptase domain-containing protein [Tanacetum cinerariifolium]
MELDEHTPIYVPEPQHPEYHAPSDDDIQVEDDDDDPDEDLEEDPSEEHEPEDNDEDPEEDPNEEHESKGSDETEPFKEDKIVVTPPPSRHCGARISVRPQTPMAASTQALIDAFASGSSPFPLPPTSPAYDQAQLGRRAAMIHRKDDILVEDMPPKRIFTLTGPPPGCDVAESSAAAAARAPRSQYDFVDTGLIHSPGHDTQTIARAADRAEDASYNRELLARLEMLETHMSHMEWQRQSAEDLAVTQMMRIHTLEARGRVDTVEDADSSYSRTIVGSYFVSKQIMYDLTSCYEMLMYYVMVDLILLSIVSWLIIIIMPNCIDIVIISHEHCIFFVIGRIMPVTRQGTNDAMTPESIQSMIDRAIQRNSTHTQDDASQSSCEGLRRPVQPARVCSYTDFMKCQPLNFKGTEGVVGLSQWLEKMVSVFQISGCAVDNQVKFATCTLLGAALTWWNGHVRTLCHDAAYAMTWGTLKKKFMDKYCLKGEIKKLEIKLWNLRVKGNDVAAYTQRFQELALMCTKFLADETEKVDKYINGLPDNIHGNVMCNAPLRKEDVTS